VEPDKSSCADRAQRIEMQGSIDYAGVLLECYRALLSMYERLEVLSEEVFDALRDVSRLDVVQEKLREKMKVVEDIGKVSKEIAALKTKLRLSEPYKRSVREAEKILTDVVARVIDREDRSRELFQRYGVKVSRR